MKAPAHLFAPVTLRGVTFSNRIAVSPMCEYSSEDGFASDWHLVHLGSRAIGGAGLVMTEAAGVTAEGRITPFDLGIWKDAHIAMLKRIVDFLHAHGSHAGIQLAHAGRKASMSRPWEPGPAGEHVLPPSAGGWEAVVAPSAIPFDSAYAQPHELDRAGIDNIVHAFISAARRAVEAGFDVVEIHAAHGYLLHEFLSPLSNQRTDEFGGSFENRARMLLLVVDAVRREWPDELPLFVRISATDYAEGGWNIDESVLLASLLRDKGVDLVDVSSGGLVPGVSIPVGPGYQVPFAERIRRESRIATGTVGMITSPQQADQIVRNGQADMVLLAREMLRDPYWPLHAAEVLRQPMSWPAQYLRAAHRNTVARAPVAVNVTGLATK
jgi:2,4-dienoyl-CoA reductase-like NADH-dependent reductase (Old Yellow Enzyme family)